MSCAWYAEDGPLAGRHLWFCGTDQRAVQYPMRSALLRSPRWWAPRDGPSETGAFEPERAQADRVRRNPSAFVVAAERRPLSDEDRGCGEHVASQARLCDDRHAIVDLRRFPRVPLDKPIEFSIHDDDYPCGWRGTGKDISLSADVHRDGRSKSRGAADRRSPCFAEYQARNGSSRRRPLEWQGRDGRAVRTARGRETHEITFAKGASFGGDRFGSRAGDGVTTARLRAIAAPFHAKPAIACGT
jgi:hypothetical protein